jgi:NitT/TauT family transport system substrate-binding protein
MMKLGTIVAAALAAFAMAGGPAAAQETVKVGFLPNSDFLPAFIAKEKNLFQKHGVKVELEKITLIANMPPAMLAGSLQIGFGTGPNFLSAVEAGIDFVAISGATRQTTDHSTVSIIVGKDSGIKTPADLKGKKIGIPGLAGLFDWLFREWLVKHGLKPGDVTLIETPFPQMADLLRTKQLDVVLAIEPIRSRIVAAGLGTRMADYITEIAPSVISAFYMAERSWATKHVAEVHAFRAALDEGADIIAKDPAYAEKIEKQYLGFNAGVLPAFSTELTVADLKLFQDMGKELGLLKGTSDLSKLIMK